MADSYGCTWSPSAGTPEKAKPSFNSVKSLANLPFQNKKKTKKICVLFPPQTAAGIQWILQHLLYLRVIFHAIFVLMSNTELSQTHLSHPYIHVVFLTHTDWQIPLDLRGKNQEVNVQRK